MHSRVRRIRITSRLFSDSYIGTRAAQGCLFHLGAHLHSSNRISSRPGIGARQSEINTPTRSRVCRPWSHVHVECDCNAFSSCCITLPVCIGVGGVDITRLCAQQPSIFSCVWSPRGVVVGGDYDIHGNERYARALGRFFSRWHREHRSFDAMAMCLHAMGTRVSTRPR